MSRGINKVIVLGFLGADPETRYTPSGTAVANLSVATNEMWKDKNTGEQQQRTEWHRIVLFNRLAEIAGEYLTKGAQVYVEGKIQTKKWQDRDGNDRYTTEIVGNEMQMLGTRDRDGTDRQTRPAPADEDGQQDLAGSPPDDFDDDIPF